MEPKLEIKNCLVVRYVLVGILNRILVAIFDMNIQKCN